MRVAILDPEGPRRGRAARYAPFLAALIFALFGPTSGIYTVAIGIFALSMILLIAALSPLLRQRAPANAELECHAGYVKITRSGSRDQRIEARHITGATTARTDAGISLTMQHKERALPLTITARSDADAEKIRQALGIGHGGFGTLAWATRARATERAGAIALAVTGAIGMLMFASLLSGTVALAMVLGQFAFLGALFGLGGGVRRRGETTVTMGPRGLWLWTTQGQFTVPYGSVLDVTTNRGALTVSLPAPHHALFVPREAPFFGSASDADCEVLASQVLAAAQRARGLGPHKEEVAGRLDLLRRNGDSPRDWLMRLDVAGQMLSTGQGYRGHALDPQDLWTVLEDPDADAELRAAAARVLRHSKTEETRTRIVTAIAAVRDEATHRRIRIAIEDDAPDEVQLAELAELEALPRAQQLPTPPPHP